MPNDKVKAIKLQGKSYQITNWKDCRKRAQQFKAL